MRFDSLRAWLPSFLLTCLPVVPFFIPSLRSFLPLPSLSLPGCSFFFGAFYLFFILIPPLIPFLNRTRWWTHMDWKNPGRKPKSIVPINTLTLWIGRRWASCYTILEPARRCSRSLSSFPTGPWSSSRRVEMQSKTRNEVTAWEWHQTCKFCHLTADTPMTSLDSEVTQLPVPYSSPVERPHGRWNEKHAKVNRRIPQPARMCSPCNL